jgi:acyl-CoA reductase-like NAD-dependent aldehyde dehydrogenase
MPNYEVELTYIPVVVVIDAANEDEAVEHAKGELSMSLNDCLMDTKVRKLKRGRETESALMHADEVSKP